MVRKKDEELVDPELLSVGRRLQEIREAWHLNQTQMGKQIGISQSQLSRLERGVRSVKANTLLRVLRRLSRRRVNVTHLVLGDSEALDHDVVIGAPGNDIGEARQIASEQVARRGNGRSKTPAKPPRTKKNTRKA